jgi:Ni,Fe-hydrogenase III small subunit
MIKKEKLVDVINKYYLNGFNPSVKWTISPDNKLTIYAGKRGKVCKVVLEDFDIGVFEEDIKIGVFDTEQLLKLIKVTDDELNVIFKGEHGLYQKMLVKDKNFKVIYTLADTLILDKVSYYKDLDDYDIKLNLTPSEIDNLIKCQKSLTDNDKMSISTLRDEDEKPTCVFTFGENNNYSNNISFEMKGDIKELGKEMPFDSIIFDSILNNNKKCNDGVLKISSKGMMKLEFSEEKVYSEYFLTRNE